MSNQERHSHTRALVGVGLVLIGLLGGILIMLVVQDGGSRSQTEFRVVEQVEMGGTEVVSTSAGALEFNELSKDVAERVTESVVMIRIGSSWVDWLPDVGSDESSRYPYESRGSGVVISPQGYIVTNYHVVDYARDIQVVFADKREYSAEVVGEDPSTDLAVLRIELEEGEEISAVALGDADRLRAGEWVLAVGNPFGLHSTITAGIVSALGRQVNIIEDDLRIEDFIQTDAAINPGNSGGALVNMRGELIGINTMIVTTQEGGLNEGYGFAIPVNLMDRIAKDLIAYGEVKRGYLGVTIESINAVHARRLGLDEISGVYLNAVAKGSAADRGGLRQGDVVVSIAGRTISAANELQSLIARHRPGDRIAVEFLRDGRRVHARVELLGRDNPAVDSWLGSRSRLRRPTPESSDFMHLGDWGLVVRELTDRDKTRYSVTTGVFLFHVLAGSVSAAAGLPEDTIVEEVNGEPVTSLGDLSRVLEWVAERDRAAIFSVRLPDGSRTSYKVDAPEED